MSIMLRDTWGGSGFCKGIYNIPKHVLYKFTFDLFCYRASPLYWSFQESTVLFPSVPPSTDGRRVPLNGLSPLLKSSWMLNGSWIIKREDGLLGPTKCWCVILRRKLELDRQSANASSVSYVPH